MTLWERFKNIAARVGGEEPGRDLRVEEFRLAAAALLVRASVIDGRIDAAERHTVKELLQDRFVMEGELIQ